MLTLSFWQGSSAVLTLAAALSALAGVAWLTWARWRGWKSLDDARALALLDAQERARTLVEGLREDYIFFSSDREGRLVYISPSVETILGYRPDEIIGHHWREFIGGTQADLERIAEQERRRFAGEVTGPLDFPARARNGETRMLEARDFPILDARGNVALNQGIAKDVTVQRQTRRELEQLAETLEQRVEQRTAELTQANEALKSEIAEREKAEALLRESERRLAETQRMAHLGHWTLDYAGGASDWSDEAVRILGFRPASICLDMLVELVHPEDRAAMRRQLEQVRSASEPVSLEHRLLRPDGQTRWVVTRAQSQFDEAGRLARILGAFQDVTDRVEGAEKLRQREEQLARVTRLSTMGELVAGIAHEVNQPLYAIQNYASAIERTLASDTPNYDQVLEWSGQIGRMAILSGQIIKRMRHFIGRSASERSPTDVSRVVRESVEMLGFEARRRRINIDLEAPADLPRVMADEVQIAQVVINLVKNACEAFPLEGDGQRRVLVRVRLFEGAIETTVSDTGPGIPAEQARRLFEVFSTTKTDGLGMGLAISRTIVEGHHGRLWLGESELGGATFHFTLPL